MSFTRSEEDNSKSTVQNKICLSVDMLGCIIKVMEFEGIDNT